MFPPTPKDPPAGPARTTSSALLRASQVAAKMTEVRTVVTAYGPGRLAESRSQGTLDLRALPEGVRLVPYVEGEIACGVYFVDVARAAITERGAVRVPVVDTVPFFVLDQRHRDEVFAQARAAGVTLRAPAEHDLTTDFGRALAEATVLWRNDSEAGFELATFALNVKSVTGSPDFPDVYLIKTHDRERWVLAINKLIEDVIDLHPHFLRLGQLQRVRLSFKGCDNVWLAPMLRSGTVA